MKKVISLFLSIVMLVSTVACVDMSSYADEFDDFPEENFVESLIYNPVQKGVY